MADDPSPLSRLTKHLVQGKESKEGDEKKDNKNGEKDGQKHQHEKENDDEVSCSLKAFVQTNDWSEAENEHIPLKEYRIPLNGAVSIKIGTGSGQQLLPSRLSRFSVSSTTFVDECKKMGFTGQFLQQLATNTMLFEHHWDFKAENPARPQPSSSLSPPAGSSAASKAPRSTTVSPRCLDLIIANYEHDAFLLLARYNLRSQIDATGSVNALLFVKTDDLLKKFLVNERYANPGKVVSFLESRKHILGRHPLLLPVMVLEFIQSRFVGAKRWRQEMIDMESRLGITTQAQTHREGGYKEAELTIDGLRRANAELATLQRYAADAELSASITLDHARELLRLIQLAERYECEIQVTNTTPNDVPTTEQREYVQATIKRLELYLRFMKMTSVVLQNLATTLYNRINRVSSESTKTIAMLTLFFLPATFVTTVFSTGVFDFHAHEGLHRKTASKYWWPYLICCVGLTVITILGWFFWYRWLSVLKEKAQIAKVPLAEKKRKNTKASPQKNGSCLEKKWGIWARVRHRRQSQEAPASTIPASSTPAPDTTATGRQASDKLEHDGPGRDGHSGEQGEGGQPVAPPEVTLPQVLDEGGANFEESNFRRQTRNGHRQGKMAGKEGSELTSTPDLEKGI